MIVRTIDAHAAGGPLRLVVEGFPSPRGKTMQDKRAWAVRHADALRTAVVCEPRGHADLCGAVLTEPVAPDSHCGVLFFDSHGFRSLSGHGAMAVAKIALDRGLVTSRDGGHMRFDTPAGTVDARVDEDRVVLALPSRVVRAGVPVALVSRTFPADIAYGGLHYAITIQRPVALS